MLPVGQFGKLMSDDLVKVATFGRFAHRYKYLLLRADAHFCSLLGRGEIGESTEKVMTFECC